MIHASVPGDFFESKHPDIQLLGTLNRPYDLAVASARTCYSSKGIIRPEQVSVDERARALRDRVAASTREAGHLTTRQHAHFVFALSHVSRQFLWSFLHSHPYYNSEQVSQRYVKVKGNHFTIPKLGSSEKLLYEKILNLQMGAYEKLIILLMPAVTEEYFRIFKNRKRPDQRWQNVIQKKAFEVARYILPVATQAYLYHTVSALTLLRYHRVSQSADTPSEQRFIVNRMVEEVLKIDPDFEKEIDRKAILARPAEDQQSFSKTRSFIQSFDNQLFGKFSKLIDANQHAETTLADAVRLVLARTDISDQQAIDIVLDPKHNRDLGDTFNVTTLSPLSRALFQIHFTFIKKISHTADSQNQRHRMTPAARASLERHYFGEPDVVYPKLFERVPQAKKLYEDVVHQTVLAVNTLLKKGVSFEKAQYLLPNGWAVRFEESGDLLNWHHKWKLRTCYNAQEEIFYASVDELTQVSKQFPSIGKHILAPCYLRQQASMTPYCPEGDRYCGVPVWKKRIDQYDRLI